MQLIDNSYVYYYGTNVEWIEVNEGDLSMHTLRAGGALFGTTMVRDIKSFE